MKEFIIGFLTCWVFLGIFGVLSEKFDWYYKRMIDKDVKKLQGK